MPSAFMLPPQLVLGAFSPMLLLSMRVRYEAMRDWRARDTEAPQLSGVRSTNVDKPCQGGDGAI